MTVLQELYAGKNVTLYEEQYSKVKHVYLAESVCCGSKIDVSDR